MSFQLTDEQKEIVRHWTREKTNLIVDAKAGAAKTSTMEVAAKAQNPIKSIVLAYNVEIKKELASRFPEWYEAITLNGLGHRAWGKTIGKRLELDARKVGTLIRRGLNARGITDEDGSIWQNTSRLVSACKLNGLVLKGAPGAPKVFIKDEPDNWQNLIDMYDLEVTDLVYDLARSVLADSVEMAFHGNIDFDDQIYMSCCFSGSFPRFQMVMCDEVQDLSAMNHYMLRKVVANKLLCVGDPFQSIYAWRGADSKSMDRLEKMFEMEKRTLTTSFRCAKSIIAHAQKLVPEIKAWDQKPEGEVKRFKEFSADDIPDGAAVLCRNNAPLVGLAFKLLRARKPVRFVNREVGKGLVKLATKICENQLEIPCPSFIEKVLIWRDAELEKALANGNQFKADLVSDKASAIIAIAEETRTVQECLDALEDIFSNEYATITFSTGHGSKGKEWDKVFILDSWLLPSKRATSEEALQQEKNLDYVMRTRAKNFLGYINSSDYQEV